ncbi:MAG: BamA/TamA family outer membrane protein [Chitinophagaceae bacterium]|nr:BamA/TamA family outer membrane protein [Chitinophagaceae bacterium]
MYAQKHLLSISGADKDTFISLTKIDTVFNSFVECRAALNDAHNRLLQAGYLTHSIDSVQVTDSATTVLVYTGSQYVWASLKNSNIPTWLLTQSRFDERRYFGKQVEMEKLSPVFEKVLRYFEDNGYPFASFYLDSVSIINNGVNARLYLDRGPLIKIDTVVLNEDVNISHNFVTQYLGIKEGAPYNESRIKSINTRIRELAFLQESAPWRMDFTSTTNKLNIFLKPKSANRADVLVGLQPSTQETGGKFLLTGDIKLAFANALGQGENLQLNWQNLQYKSPRYNILISLPYLLGTPVGVSGKFDFYKKDTSFRTINGELGLFYQLNASDRIKVYYELASSRLGTVNIPALIASRKLPANADVAYKTIGAEMTLQEVDYKLNPRKGYKVLLNASVSFRNILKNSTIENTYDPVEGKNFAYLYDTLQLKNYKYNLSAQLQYFMPLGKRLILAGIYNGGIAYSTKALYRNELFQIGGYRLLRGFDEGSLFVNHYHVLTLEPRYLISLNSYFFLFSDLAYVQSKFADVFIKDTPCSVGFGMAFETKAGIFNISYGVGKSTNQDFELKNSKVHFGYISVF